MNFVYNKKCKNIAQFTFIYHITLTNFVLIFYSFIYIFICITNLIQANIIIGVDSNYDILDGFQYDLFSCMQVS